MWHCIDRIKCCKFKGNNLFGLIRRNGMEKFISNFPPDASQLWDQSISVFSKAKRSKKMHNLFGKNLLRRTSRTLTVFTAS